MTARDICVAYTEIIHRSYSDKFFQNVTNHIKFDEKSNIIVLFMQVSYSYTNRMYIIYYNCTV